MNDGTITGIGDIERTLSALSREVTDGLVLRCLQAGGKVLQERTRTVLRSKKLGKHSASNRGASMTRGVTNKTDRAYGEVRVSIMGDYRLKWFELGTGDRRLKRTGAKDRTRGRYRGDRRYLYRKEGKENFYRAGAYRGKIQPVGFFREARADDASVISAIEKEFERQIGKILK